MVGGFAGAFFAVFFGDTIVFFAAAATAVELAAAFALADALAVRYNLVEKLLAASNAPVETPALLEAGYTARGLRC
jgi:hypothetical protein